jgi:hypothetical protein
MSARGRAGVDSSLGMEVGTIGWPLKALVSSDDLLSDMCHGEARRA